MEIIVGLKELRQNVSVYVNKVKQGKSFIVVKRSKPLFKIVPLEEEGIWERVIDFTKIKKGGVNVKDILCRI
ncbi:MAG: type II toxin-antitoxin system prevent-host-death family antitoxin [Bacteroidetes bacterium]|nr:type II toxin-antitoxin system prevent-host-death family antitoxin [Bacteroidota bacterium]